MSYESIFSFYESSRREIDRIFEYMVKFEASDLHIKANASPALRIGGSIRGLDMPALNPEQCEKLIFEIMSEEHRRRYDESGDAEFTHMLPAGERFRINVYRERGTVALSARLVANEIPSFEQLALPEATIKNIIDVDAGLILLSGITGSGKSTTIAAMIDYINRNRRCHIITIEDPIEYLYKDKKAFINQREIGTDVSNFTHALKSIVRQDPDVIVAGELRDYETFNFGITAAETGHLVFGTMHASAATHIISRILDLFPADRHLQVRQSLAFNLRAVICQRLLPSIRPGHKMVPALEIMIINGTARKLILEGNDKKLIEVIKASRNEGMIDFTHSLAQLVEEEFITEETALAHAPNREALRMVLQGIDLSEEGGIIN